MVVNVYVHVWRVVNGSGQKRAQVACECGGYYAGGKGWWWWWWGVIAGDIDHLQSATAD
jgi:hypothetical protein